MGKRNDFPKDRIGISGQNRIKKKHENLLWSQGRGSTAQPSSCLSLVLTPLLSTDTQRKVTQSKATVFAVCFSRLAPVFQPRPPQTVLCYWIILFCSPEPIAKCVNIVFWMRGIGSNPRLWGSVRYAGCNPVHRARSSLLNSHYFLCSKV